MFGSIITRVSINICTTMENKRGEAWTHEETVSAYEIANISRRSMLNLQHQTRFTRAFSMAIPLVSG
jgi:hypothetical protein